MALSQSIANSSARAYDQAVSFYDLIMGLESGHEKMIDKELCYKVYVHCPFVGHHCIVLANDLGLGCLTLELTVNNDVPDGRATSTVAPKVQLYSGDVNQLSYKGEVECTLERLSECAYEVLLSMGQYNLALNNCQHFCDKFLDKIGLPGHVTDTTKIGIGGVLVAGAVGIGAIGYGLYKMISGNSKEDTSNENYVSKKKTRRT